MSFLIERPSASTASPSPRMRYLVCIDIRAESHVALRMACIKAQKRGGLVDILHVLEPAESESLFGASDRIRQEREQEAKGVLLSLSQIAEGITGQKPGLLLKEGPVGETVLKVAQDNSVNMLVLSVVQGSGRGRLVAWLAGQLGEKLLLPMMLIPASLSDAQMLEIS